MPNPFCHDLALLDKATAAWLERPAAHFIDGEWVKASATLPVLDPSSGIQIAEIGSGGATEIDEAVAAAQRGLRSSEWAGIGPLARERLILNLVGLIEKNASTLAQIETLDNGMPSWFALGPTILGAADVYRYYAGWPTKITGQTLTVEGPPGTGDFRGFTQRSPVGVIGAIIPWNVPFLMAAWKLAPALAAGCTIVLKPAEDTSLSALKLAELVAAAGIPRGVVNIVTGLGPQAGEALVRHPGIAKISFTGSTATGRRIGEIAGAALKKHTLELGGKSPVLLFDDADLDEAVSGAAASIFLNSGQICVAGSRLYVQSRRYDEVLERLHRHLATIKVGAGLTPGVFMGPLVNAAQKARVANYINGAQAAGFTVLRGAAVDETAGNFVSPTIVAGADGNAAITREEIFGPVLSVYRFDDDEEAVTLANNSDYGLAATIWSANISRVLRVCESLECGKVLVNNAGFPYPGLPEGGRKASGHGKDLGQDALDACLQTRSIIVRI